MIAASTVPTLAAAAFATLAVTGVAALTVKVELTAHRFEALKKSLTRLAAGLGEQPLPVKADNVWLTSIIHGFDDER